MTDHFTGLGAALTEQLRRVQQRRDLSRALMWTWLALAAVAGAGWAGVDVLWLPVAVLVLWAMWRSDRAMREPKPGGPLRSGRAK